MIRPFKSLFLVVIMGSAAVYSCGGDRSGTSNEQPVMYQQSELAALMHEIHDLSASWKEQLENGDSLTPLPAWTQDILHAEATNPAELVGAFDGMAAEYLNDLERLMQAAPEEQKMLFNRSIQTCVSCHQIYCNGPIPKIKKLTIQ